MTGAGRRAKGHSFERFIANVYRKRWPDRVVRRSQQAHQAYEPDVVVEGVPLWTECQHASTTTPLAKLAQAERDVLSLPSVVYPVAVWRKTGERRINATMRLRTLLITTNQWWASGQPYRTAVTVDFLEWLSEVDW